MSDARSTLSDGDLEAQSLKILLAPVSREFGFQGPAKRFVLNPLWILGYLSSFMLKRRRRPKKFRVNGLVFLPIPLCMSSFFRSEFEVAAYNEQVDVLIARSDSERLVTAYKKKVLGHKTDWKKMFLLGRWRIKDASVDAFVDRALALTEQPFFDLHFTTVASFCEQYPDARVINLNDSDEFHGLERLLRRPIRAVNRSSQIMAKLEDDAKIET